MRQMLRGLAVATALTLSPLSVAALPSAPAQAAESTVAQVDSRAAVPTASTAPAAKAKARRTISLRDLPGRNARIRIAVKPKYANKPLIIQTRKAGKFKTTGRIRTNSRGVAVKVFDGSRRGIRYRVIAKGGQDFYTAAVAFTIVRS